MSIVNSGLRPITLLSLTESLDCLLDILVFWLLLVALVESIANESYYNDSCNHESCNEFISEERIGLLSTQRVVLAGEESLRTRLAALGFALRIGGASSA